MGAGGSRGAEAGGAALREVRLLQLAGARAGGGEAEHEDDDGADDGELAAALARGGTVAEGQVVARSRLKVVRTEPRGAVGRVEAGKTRVRVDCAFSQGAAELRGDVALRKLLLAPARRTAAGGWAPADISARTCLEALRNLSRAIKASGGALHVVEGQGLPAPGIPHGEVWLLARACEPRSGGIVDADTAVHFSREPQALRQAQHVRLLPVDDAVAQAAGAAGPLGAALATHLRDSAPVYVERGQRLWLPVLRRRIPGRQARAAPPATTPREDLRQRRLAYFQQEGAPGGARPAGPEDVEPEVLDAGAAEIREVFMVEWRVMDVAPGRSGVLGSESSLYTERDSLGDVDALVDAQLDEIPGPATGPLMAEEGVYDEGGEASSLCLRCGGQAEAPRSDTRCAVFCCPCGQPMANRESPFWMSVNEMARSSAEGAARPSVMFLSELREVIAVMPMQDARTSVLHSSLNVFPLTRTGGVDFEQADRLVLLIMPSLRQRPQGLDPAVLARLPVSTFASMRTNAARREATTCCICMESYRPEEELRTLPCFHFMHKDCVDRWLQTARTCPLCKFEVS